MTSETMTSEIKTHNNCTNSNCRNITLNLSCKNHKGIKRTFKLDDLISRVKVMNWTTTERTLAILKKI